MKRLVLVIGLIGLLYGTSRAGYTIDPNDPNERGRLWDGGKVPYAIDPSLDATSRTNIAKSIADFHAKTNLRWVPRTNEHDYVLFNIATFTAEGGGAVGRQVGKQEIKMKQGGGYAGTGTIIHEMGHTVGLYHEHDHPERATWVEFIGDLSKEWDKVCYDFFLTSAKPGKGRSNYFRWDSESIMSTSHGCFLNPPNDPRGWPAVFKVKPGYPGNPVVRDWFVLSKGDAATINALYADKSPSKYPPDVCTDDPGVGSIFCGQFKAKGDCEAYSMVIAAWQSCKATCELCKGAAAPAPAPTPQPQPPPDDSTIGKITDTRLVEISGVDASLKYPGVFYVHNDSGDSARFFAINLQGQTLGEFKLEGATARDWEDMSSGYCGGVSCLWFADIGDNSFNRKDYKIYEVEEPAALVKEAVVKYKAYGFQYPKGASFNSEAFSWNPLDGFFYIVTKGENALYRLPKPLMQGMQANKMCDLGIKQDVVTALDFNDAGEMLVRTYSQVHRFKGACGALIESLPLREQQGEAIAYLNGTTQDFLTVSEGSNQPININRKSAPLPVHEPEVCESARLLMKQHGCKL